jgi:hypothetical protein
MKRKELLDMVQVGSSIVRGFLADGDGLASSYEDWNSRDVVGHIVGWMNYSSDKLSCIKHGRKQNEKYTGITSLDEINRILYNQAATKTAQDLESDYLSALGDYIKAISLFSDSEIGLSTFDTGFKMELWRYMVMDTVIHPTQHILYQLLKRGQYGKVFELIITSEGVFERYSAGRKAYQLQEFQIDRPQYQSWIDEMAKRYSDVGAIKEFVSLNRVASS